MSQEILTPKSPNVSIGENKVFTVTKRTGEVVSYDVKKIMSAISKCFLQTKEGGDIDAMKVSIKVDKELTYIMNKSEFDSVHVEKIQDLVEKHLMLEDYTQSAKAYILYRNERNLNRKLEIQVTPEVKELFDQSKKYFRNPLAEFVYYRSYSKWMDDKNRRETWIETINRFMDYMRSEVGSKISEKDYDRVYDAMLNQRVVPSMRLLWSAGPAASKTHVAAYNCSYIAITDLKDFSEIMYVAMCGTGVGFSVENKFIANLPLIQPQSGEINPIHTVEDSKEGWADAFHLALTSWFSGKDISFDYSKIRPKGSRLKTMGGRASGPAPLIDLMNFTKEIVFKKQGQRLSSLEVHDIACKVGEIVIMGGVRRSAMISLSDLGDESLRHSKDGQFWNNAPHRIMANNSAVYEVKPTSQEFLKEWGALVASGSGERGIFNRGGLTKQLPSRRIEAFDDNDPSSWGTNPCGEITLRSKQFCNLTSIVVRKEDTLDTMLENIEVATILGTYQASLTNFPYLSKEWTDNCRKEALLGVSLTGYFDNDLVRNVGVLEQLRLKTIEVNKEYADKLGINQSTCVTCIKPSGNSSQLLDTASGMHPRYSQYYIRRVRVSSTDPIYKMMKDQGISCKPEVGQNEDNATTWVLEFPVKAPEGAIFKDDVSAIELLEEWKKLKVHFTEHNPSVTIYVGDNEWIEVANWIYSNWDIVGGLSFLPRSDFVYQLAPYEEVSREVYEEVSKNIKEIDFSELVTYEFEDETLGSKELACASGNCEI